MRKSLICSALSCVIMFSSCSHTIYNTKVLQGNYDLRMDTKEELEIKSKVQIFLSEKDVKDDYEIISINKYGPIFTIPLLYTYKTQIKQKFYEKAVKKAYDLGGNGIIITAGGYYDVISIYNWDSDNVEATSFINSILNTTLLETFTSGRIANLKQREIKRYVEDLRNEIGFNLKTMRTSQEAEIVAQKINALISWNNSQTKLDSKLDKELKAYQKTHQIIQKRILKKENK